MFCPHCGYENTPGAGTCKRCGNPLPLDTSAQTRVVGAQARPSAAQRTAASAQARAQAQQGTYYGAPTQATTVMPVAVHDAARAKPGTGVPQGATSYNAVPLKTRRPKWWVVAIFLLLAAAVVAFAATQVLKFLEDQQTQQAQQAVYDEAHQLGTVDLTFYIDGYLEGSSSPIPIRIEGADIDGNAVSRLELMSMASHKVDLPRGTYTFTPAGNPVSAGGTLFLAPVPATIDVDAEGVAVDTVRKPGPEFLYTPEPADQLTEAQINDVRVWMVDAGMDMAAVQKYLDALANARSAAQDAANTAQRTADKAAQQNVETGAFAFVVPDAWLGQVDVVKTTDEDGDPVATVVLKGSSLALVEVSIVPSSWELTEGDIGYHLAANDVANGYRVEMWSTNWAWEAAAGTSGLDDDTLNSLVRLSTGGAMNLNSAVAAGTEGVGTPDVDFIRQQNGFSLTAR